MIQTQGGPERPEHRLGWCRRSSCGPENGPRLIKLAAMKVTSRNLSLLLGHASIRSHRPRAMVCTAALMVFSTLSNLSVLPARAWTLPGASDHTPPAVQPATDFAAVEVHADEKLAVAAEPFDTKDKMAIFRVDYIAHGVLPVRLIVTNNADHPVSLRDARILFVTAQGDRIQAADPADVERLMTLKEKEGAKIPLPGPLPPIRRKPKASDKQIEQDFDTFEFQALVVEAHTTRAGFLFYDVSGLRNPLKGATLNLRKIMNSDGKELFYFEIPFDKYLKTKSSQMH